MCDGSRVKEKGEELAVGSRLENASVSWGYPNRSPQTGLLRTMEIYLMLPEARNPKSNQKLAGLPMWFNC